MAAPNPFVCHKCKSPLKVLYNKGSGHPAKDEAGRPIYKCPLCKAQTSDPLIDRLHADQLTQLPLGKGLVVEAPADFDLFLTSDWHCGSNVCDYAGLRAMIQRALATPNARMIIGGDQMEMTPPGHHDGGRDSTCYPDQQIIRTVEGLKPIKDRLDLVYGGNHGRSRFLQQSQIDPDLILSYSLGVKYAVCPTVVQYRTPKGVVKVAGGHGKSGAQNSLLEIRKLANIFSGCDLYHLGHDHNLFAQQEGGMEYDAEGDEHWTSTWYCRTGSFLRYAQYARFAFYQPKPTGYLIANIRGGAIRTVEVVKS